MVRVWMFWEVEVGECGVEEFMNCLICFLVFFGVVGNVFVLVVEVVVVFFVDDIVVGDWRYDDCWFGSLI